MKRELERLLGVMTGGRHSKLEMDGSLPTAVAHTGATMVPWDQLSTGTKDALALGVRLAMAARLLGSADGFLLMDDPLVDMDPERQRTASLALKEFAASRAAHPLHLPTQHRRASGREAGYPLGASFSACSMHSAKSLATILPSAAFWIVAEIRGRSMGPSSTRRARSAFGIAISGGWSC